MDAASVPSTGEVLLVHCLGFSSPKTGEQSFLSPSSTEDMGHRQIQSFARTQLLRQRCGHPPQTLGSLFPQQSAVGSHLSEPLICHPASSWDLPQGVPFPGPLQLL